MYDLVSKRLNLQDPIIIQIFAVVLTAYRYETKHVIVADSSKKKPSKASDIGGQKGKSSKKDATIATNKDDKKSKKNRISNDAHEKDKEVPSKNLEGNSQPSTVKTLSDNINPLSTQTESHHPKQTTPGSGKDQYCSSKDSGQQKDASTSVTSLLSRPSAGPVDYTHGNIEYPDEDSGKGKRKNQDKQPFKQVKTGLGKIGKMIGNGTNAIKNAHARSKNDGAILVPAKRGVESSSLANPNSSNIQL